MESVKYQGEYFDMQKVKVSFMTGNKDLNGLVDSVLTDNYSMKEILDSDIDFDNAIYSDGFIEAICDGLVPVLELYSTIYKKGYEQAEYHHVCINNECFKMYFKEA
jgi:hypothetical protein